MSRAFAFALLAAAALAALALALGPFSRRAPRSGDLGPALLAAAPRMPRDVSSGATTLLELDFSKPEHSVLVRGEAGFAERLPGEDGVRFEVADAANFIAIDLPEWEGGHDAGRATMMLLGIGATKGHDVTRLYWTAPGVGPGDDRALPIDFAYFDGTTRAVIALEDSPAWIGDVTRLWIRLGLHPSDLLADPPVLTISSLVLLRTTLAERFAIEDAGTFEPGARAAFRPVKIGPETRPALLAPAPSRIEITVDVPADDPILEGAFALHPGAFGRNAGPIEFAVLAEGNEIYARSIDPREANDRKWIEFRAAPGSRAGEKGVRLAFVTRGGDSRASAYALWSRPRLTGSSGRTGEPHGVILVSLDTVRADRLGAYGRSAEPATSPAFDALAAESVLFERAYSVSPETLTAHMSVFTGCVPSVHRVNDVGVAIADDVVTVAERFAAAGHATAAFTEGGNVGAAFGFWQGFDSFSETGPGARGEKRSEETFAAAAGWLERHADRPFFLFVHTYEAHTPYDPPEAARRLFDPGYDGPYETGVSWQDVETMILGGEAKERDFRHVARLYDASIRHLDSVFGLFVHGLRSRGHLDRSVLAVFSDHGEDFFDHFGFATHGHTLYDDLLHVPLLVRAPGLSPRRVTEPVGTLSIGATILDLARLEPLPGRVQAKSLARALRGEGESGDAGFVFAEDATFFPRFSVRDGPWKYVRNPTIEKPPGAGENPEGGLVLANQIRRILAADRFAWTGIQPFVDGWLREEELYDLEADPEERNNLAAGRPEEADRLRIALDRYLRSLPGPLPTRAWTLGDEALERLKELGYIK